MVALENFGRPGALTDESLASLWARISSREGLFRTKLANMIAKGIKLGTVNVGYFHNAKGIVAEILAEGYRQSVLGERQKINPDARQFSDVHVVRAGSDKAVQFTDGLIGYPEGGGLTVTDRFEVKSGPAGGEFAERQHFKWVESHIDDGTRLLLNKRPAAPGERPGPGLQERIGDMIYDVYYWNPTPKQRTRNPELHTVTGLSGGSTLHAIMPEGGAVLSAQSGAHTVPVTSAELPATASTINYLTRLIIERITTP
jgi:hypothetical protein